jgi:type 1 glutamine amidotransferase
VKRNGEELSFSEKTLTEIGAQAGFDVHCTKDGTVFDGDLDQYDAIAFYTSGDLTKTNQRETPPMSPQGKQRLLDAIAAGTGFVGFHSATDTFHSPGPRGAIQPILDPYIAMIGGEFVTHGAQQEATLRVTSASFPGLTDVGQTMRLREEWYAMKNFAPDLHVILLQDTDGMSGDCYQRPPFPATWARMHDKGRVYYTSFGHRDDIWTNPQVQQIMLGGFAWAMGNVVADVTPNIDAVAPQANQMKN